MTDKNNIAYMSHDGGVQHIACAECFDEQFRPSIVGPISAAVTECEFCGDGSPPPSDASPYVGNPLMEDN